MKNAESNIIQEVSFTKMEDYQLLVKLRLSLVVVLTSVLGYAIVAGSSFNALHAVFLGIAGFLTTASANALNQVLEKDFDKEMERTKDRPIAAGRMKSSEAVMFAGISCLIGITMLAMFNPLTALLGMLSLITYSFIYTPLKRYSTIAVSVGAIPGALPVMIGYVSVTGRVDAIALSLFTIQFLWQFPHFWAIGFLAFDDYKKAGYRLLPEESGKIARNIGKHSAIYAMIIVPIFIVNFTLNQIEFPGVIIGVLATLGYASFGLKLQQNYNRRSALLLMFSSFFYLPIVLCAYLIWTVN